MRTEAEGASRRLSPWLVLLAWTAAGPLLAEAAGWRVETGEVVVVCPMTIGGSFEATARTLSGTLALASSHPAALGGSLAVDLRSLDSGIGLRNTHMREKYLQVDKGEGYDKAVLSEIQLPKADDAGFEGTTPFKGTLALHGTSRPVAGQAQIKRQARGVHVEASFPVALPDYGIDKPRYLGVGVKDQVQVKVSFVALPAAPDGGAR